MLRGWTPLISFTHLPGRPEDSLLSEAQRKRDRQGYAGVVHDSEISAGMAPGVIWSRQERSHPVKVARKPCSTQIEADPTEGAMGTAAHISGHNKHPGIDGVGSRDTVAGVNTNSLSECDGHKCRSRSCYRSVQRGRPWALPRLVLLTKAIPVGSHKKLGCHPQPEVPKSCHERINCNCTNSRCPRQVNSDRSGHRYCLLRSPTPQLI